MNRNTDHDEEFNRRTWTGEAWLGIESMQPPIHGEPRRIMSGTYGTTERGIYRRREN